MDKKTSLIKSIVKKGVEQKPTFGTDPNDPWSAKANINETALLNKYLKSRGINPQFVTKDQKVAHSKTNQFKVWLSAHAQDQIREGMSQEHTPTEKRQAALKKSLHVHKEIRTTNGDKQLHSEAVDKKDTITFDIPLLIRVLEFAREDLKSDIALHKMVERLLNIRGKGTLTMNQYGTIVKEEFSHLSEERIDEISKELSNRYMHAAFADRRRTDDKMFTLRDRQDTLGHNNRNKITKLLKKSDKRTTGISRALNRITKEETEQLDEISKETLHSYATAGHKKYDEIRHKNDPASISKKAKLVKGIKKAAARMNPPAKPTPDPTAKDKYKLGGRDPLTNRSWSEEVEQIDEVHGAYIAAMAAMPAAAYVGAKLGNKLADYQDKKRKEKAKAELAAVKARRDAKKMNKEEVEAVQEGSAALRFAQALKREREARELKDKTRQARETQGSTTQNKPIQPVKETLEPMAACNQPFDTANNPDDVAPKRSSKLKMLLGGKKGQVKEELYDHEKEDKSVASYGKKPKMQITTKEQSFGDNKPKASAVLSGGKTMTGQPRDTVEIDPMMKKVRPGQFDPKDQKTNNK